MADPNLVEELFHLELPPVIQALSPAQRAQRMYRAYRIALPAEWSPESLAWETLLTYLPEGAEVYLGRQSVPLRAPQLLPWQQAQSRVTAIAADLAAARVDYWHHQSPGLRRITTVLWISVPATGRDNNGAELVDAALHRTYWPFSGLSVPEWVLSSHSKPVPPVVGAVSFPVQPESSGQLCAALWACDRQLAEAYTLWLTVRMLSSAERERERRRVLAQRQALWVSAAQQGQLQQQWEQLYAPQCATLEGHLIARAMPELARQRIQTEFNRQGLSLTVRSPGLRGAWQAWRGGRRPVWPTTALGGWLMGLGSGPERDTGVLLRTANGSAYLFDPFDTESSPNTLILGVAGSGKRYFQKELAANHFAQGGQVWVLNGVGDYRRPTQVFSGESRELHPNAFQGLNPFSMVKTEDQLLMHGTDLADWVLLLIGESEPSYRDRSVMEHAIFRLYRRDSHLTLTELASLLAEHSDTVRWSDKLTVFLASALANFVQGEFIPPTNRWVHFSWWELPGGSESVDEGLVTQTLMLLALMTWENTDCRERKMLVVDDLDLLRRRCSVSLLERQLRRMRMLNAAFLSADNSTGSSRNGTPARDAVLRQTAHVLLLHTTAEAWPYWQTYLRLPDTGPYQGLRPITRAGVEGSAWLASNGRAPAFVTLSTDVASDCLYDSSPKVMERFQTVGAAGAPLVEVLRQSSRRPPP